jgi:hypothetical protein
MTVESGQVHEVVCSCLWADSFIQADYIQCDIDYCHEIDAAVVRGFNPYLDYELVGNIYTKEQCDFFFGIRTSQKTYWISAIMVFYPVHSRKEILTIIVRT